jgi:aspartyl/asparaginyl beta-hydroxylase (cupin superfamily)
MPVDSIQQHLAEAERARRAGFHDEAREHFEAVVALDSEEPTARNFLGADAMRRGDARSAASHFEMASRREPDQAAHWINLATARRALGDTGAERQALEKILEIDQRDLLALIRLAELHERQNEESEAEDRWKAVLALSKSVASPSSEFTQLVNHARSYVQDRRGKLSNAVEEALANDLSGATVRDRRRMQVATDAWLGRRDIFANHCEGLHYPFLPADEFFDREHFPWIEQLEAATGTIISELKAILADPAPGLTPYISLPRGVPESKWSGLDKSLDWGAFHLWKEGERFDEACARAPRTAGLVESLPICRIDGRAPNVFFSILKAGAHIPAHTGVTNVRSVVHLPLIVPAGCEFRVGGETRPWSIGEAFAFDDTIEHEAWNRSGEDRAVLILDVWNPHLSEHERSMVCQLYAAADVQRRPLG